jgi:hypothetical protein
VQELEHERDRNNQEQVKWMLPEQYRNRNLTCAANCQEQEQWIKTWNVQTEEHEGEKNKLKQEQQGGRYQYQN